MHEGRPGRLSDRRRTARLRSDGRQRLNLESFVSETIALDEVEKAFERMHHGDVLRSVVVL